MTAVRTVVLDASVFVRSIVEPRGESARWIAAVDQGKVQGHTAALAFTEVANALLGYVRADALTLADAAEAIRSLASPALQVHGPELATAALGAAVEFGISAYDGTYAALTESLDAVLVTADRRLAAAVGFAELVV